ncbi:Abscisic acid G-protein coupled receptor-domain-containing protein [Dichotomocladium elegans]|nr:Abscisic acid G-protein coupled receptor-domain-containing protein [Dichotomocladium elegans]
MIDSVILPIVQLVILTAGANAAFALLFKDPFTLTFTNIIFALTTSCSCMLFLLVFTEIMDLFSTTLRSQFWRFNLYMLLFLVVLLIPWYQLYTFLRQTRGWRQKLAVYFTCVGWTIYLYLFTRVSSDKPLTWTELAIFRVGTVGVTVISILSGIGVVNTPYNTFRVFQKSVSDRDLRYAQTAYDQTRDMIQAKKHALSRMTKHGEQPQSSSIGRIMSVFGSSKSEYDLLKNEIEQLEHLAEDMTADLSELSREHTRSQFSRTWRGKCWIAVKHVFSIYCIYKLCVTTFNVLFHRVGNTDPISRMLSLLISQFGISDAGFWSQQLSFWFVGIIVFGSVRGFVSLLSKILRSFSRRMIMSKANITLFVAHMMGMYFLSSVLMMQNNIPPEYRHLLSSSISAIEFDYFRRWSDIIFVISWLLAAVVLYVLHQTNDARNLASDFADIQLDSVA